MNKEIEKQDESKIKTVVLILTHGCNLNCTYCYEHHKGEPRMEIAEARKIIHNEMCEDDEFDRTFEFFGGEPFIEFEKIVELHNYLSKNRWQKKWSVIITTNGTLLNDSIKDWLIRNKGTVQVALSADGTPYMHNINRSNSYSSIDFDFFAKRWSIAKMTISENTLPHLSEGIMYLHKLGFKTVTSNLAFGIDWSAEENISVFADELHKLADFYIENPQIVPANILDLSIEDINPQKRSIATRYCGAGVQMIAYEFDGSSYPCHTFAPISVGDDIAKKSQKLTFETEVSIDRLDEKCQNCIVGNVCPNCYGINFSSTGNMYSKADDYCRMVKVQFIANAYFKYMQYEAGQLKMTPEEEYRLLNNISLIQQLQV